MAMIIPLFVLQNQCNTDVTNFKSKKGYDGHYQKIGIKLIRLILIKIQNVRIVQDSGGNGGK
jgi:hypothetical protein